MTMFAAAGDHPLLKGWMTWIEQQEWTWPAEAATLGARAQWLVCNDPFVAALYQAHLQGTLGPLGPRLTSLYDATPEDPGTDDQTRRIRRQINAISAATWTGHALDRERVRTRRELEEALDWFAFVLGDGFAVRVSDGLASSWRLIHPDRVGNPGGIGNRADLRDGFVLADGAVVGLWVNPPIFAGNGQYQAAKSAPVFIPWTAADGTPNVIHVTGLRLPGMLRGVSRLAPIVVMMRQIGGVLESHVAGKRLQAILGLIVEAEDPDAFAAAKAAGNALDPSTFQVDGPLNVWVKPPNTNVQFTDTKFNGADLAGYLEICYKVGCASLSMPVDVVLCQMGNASLSSARAGLDQFDRTNQTEQERHIASCSSQIDAAAVADAITRGELSLPAVTPAALAAKYSRPPKYSTDSLKDANTVIALVESGVSKTTAFQRVYGLNWEDEQELTNAQNEFQAAQLAAMGVAVPGGTGAPAGSVPGQVPPGAPALPGPPVDQPNAFTRLRNFFAFRRQDAA